MTSSLHSTPLFNCTKLLQQSDRRIPHLCQRKVLSKTNSWTTVEGDICPGDGSPSFPSRGIEVFDGGSKKVFSSLHAHCGVGNGGVGWDGNWLEISGFVGGGGTSLPWGPPPVGRVVSTNDVLTLKGTMGYKRRANFRVARWEGTFVETPL